jgi:ATP-dependent helicase/nuclease subunit B
MSAPLTETELLSSLTHGSRVVLPNLHAARALRRAFDDRQRALGLAAWDAPAVLSWTDWTRSLWSTLITNGAELRLLLNSAQEHALWLEVVESSQAGSQTSATRSLGSPDSLADLARSAFHLAAQHQALSRLRQTATTFDSRTFAAWAESFTRLAASQNCISPSQLDAALRDHILAGSLRFDADPPRPILFAGFADPEALTPAQTALLDALRSTNHSIQVTSLALPHAPNALRANIIAPTPHEELELAAHWLRRFLEDHATPAQTPRIAVLLPDPERDQAELDSVLRQVLTPELQPIAADLSFTPWEFVAGSPLAQQPMVADALDLLRWAHSPLSLERISALLRSPFLGSSADRLTIARFDAQTLRRGPLLIPELSLADVRSLALREARRTNSLFSSVPWLDPVADLLNTRLRSTPNRLFADWAELFRLILRAANFPATSPDRSFTAADFATTRAWDTTLDLLSTLDFRGRRVPFAEALRTLEHLVQSARVNQPSHAPIQVMRPDDAEGSVFDAVLILRATDDAWPPSESLHPLLGWPLQQSLNLPGADAARDIARARSRAESLLTRTTHILITTAAANAEGAFRPSPLLQHLNLTPLNPAQLFTPAPPTPPLKEDLFSDDAPLPRLPAADLRGGANVLKLQAACGFLAFAETRLRADSPEASELGLDPAERGELVHTALQHFWELTRSQAELGSLTPAERTRRLDYAIDAAFTRIRSTSTSPSETWPAAYLTLQRDRLRTLLNRWLDEELRRGPFTVLDRESSRTITIGPLRLSVRPDRIDEVPPHRNPDELPAPDAQPGLALVDYKTGYAARPANWLGDRPDDPQLPLYALLTEPGRLQAMLFAKIRPGKEMQWLGLESAPGVLPAGAARTTTDLNARVAEWSSVLTTLAEDFARGRAEVRPKSFALNCSRCAQRLLCRLDPASLLASDFDDEELEQQEEQEEIHG